MPICKFYKTPKFLGVVTYRFTSLKLMSKPMMISGLRANRTPVKNFRLNQSFSNGTFACRSISTAPALLAASKNDFKDSVLLPKTKFSIRYAAAEVEQKYRARCTTDIYRWQGDANRGPEFILHDGPPYANGSLHIGHALNKVLKDIINRYKLLRGYRVRYIPGWDCHGLPIELKALAKLKVSNMTPLAIRKVARETALKAIEEQKEDLKKWGIMADWNDIYRTLDSEYVASQLEVFKEFLKKGYVYRQYRPSHWSPSSQTALAESELEYNDKHVSTSAYVKMLINSWGELDADSNTPTYALIWTTTPWTLTSNQAIAVHPEIHYSLLRSHQHKCNYLMASSLVPQLSAELGPLELIQGFSGSTLKGTTYLQPITGAVKPFILADFVTETTGTGLVHSAPGHGMTDYLACHPLGIEITSQVDSYGKFTEEAEPRLQGKDVLKDGTSEVLAIIAEKGLLVSQAPYTHSYPYDWRTKKPIIQRATAQWFVNLSQVTQDALQALGSVATIPASGRNRLSKFLLSRSEWCISRQRSWGVPIPVFYHPESGEPLLDDEVISHVIDIIKAEGPDAWWTKPTASLLPAKYATSGTEYQKGTDTMDVWFDSGSSWSLIQKRFPRDDFVADVYLEGSDQHRGWFQSSLLTAMGACSKLPYRTLITHGFLMDQAGAKMSKSLGNVIPPNALINGGKETKPMGADGMRFWVASSDYTQDIHVGPKALASTLGGLAKIRNSTRFMLANLFDFHESKLLPYDQLHGIDKLVLHELNLLTAAITDAFDCFTFSRAVHDLFRFSSATLSAFYFDICKDRLYLMRADSSSRRSAQTVLFHVLNSYIRFIAPVGCHMAEEIFDHAKFLFTFPPDSVFKMGWPEQVEEWNAPLLLQEWSIVHQLRSAVNSLIALAREQGVVKSSLETKVLIHVPSSDDSTISHILSQIEASNQELTTALLTSQLSFGADPVNEASPFYKSVELLYNAPGGPVHKLTVGIELTRSNAHKCPRCWMWVSPSPDSLCCRCKPIVDSFN
ncbi:isoleucine-tRNA ligase [Entomophthora muscae]|uniref:Isoleucine-tRNA ligase n=1 Tax=Entomophthora muscae TaxID=34485 RepID=A0ACC2SC44_9FUNG|nr:isoleucine-tRNA ligase [Entomophthora muscae]